MKYLLALFFAIVAMVAKGQDENSLGKFALTFNPLGFVQFGPIIGGEFKLQENLVLTAHVRIPSMGVLSYVVEADDDGLDELSGTAFGAGITYFLGSNKNKPYIGAIIGKQTVNTLYARGKQWEWAETNKSSLFFFNGGYRFRFNKGFFINTGAYLGTASTKWDWQYTNRSYGQFDPEPRSGKTINAFGMLELTVGLEF